MLISCDLCFLDAYGPALFPKGKSIVELLRELEKYGHYMILSKEATLILNSFMMTILILSS